VHQCSHEVWPVAGLYLSYQGDDRSDGKHVVTEREGR